MPPPRAPPIRAAARAAAAAAARRRRARAPSAARTRAMMWQWPAPAVVVMLMTAPPPVAATCSSDLDCSLNGLCTSGRCECDAAWEGSQCERFATLPVAPGSDLKELGTSTWGAGTLSGRLNGEYHLFASEFVGACGVTAWQTNSQVVRFAAASPKGPWARKELSLPVWAHCASAAASPNGSVVMWSFRGHKQPRLGKDPQGQRCQDGATPCGFAKHGCGSERPVPPHPNPGAGCATWGRTPSGYTCAAHHCLSDGPKQPSHCGAGLCSHAMNATTGLCAPLQCKQDDYKHGCPAAAAKQCDADPRCHGFALYKTPWRAMRAEFFATKGAGGLTSQVDWTAWTKTTQMVAVADGSTTKHGPDETFSGSLPLSVSHGPAGPWRDVAATITGGASFSIAAPWIAKNGTTMWVLQTGSWPADWPVSERAANIGLIIRASSWEGPYEVIARGACGPGEDPSIFVDKRGHVHCVYHRAPFNETGKDGGHAFSLTGRDPWFCVDGRGGHGRCTADSPPAYNTTIIYTNGTAKFGTRERPHVQVDDEGNLIALTTSVKHCQDPSTPYFCIPGDPSSCNASNALCSNQWPGYHDRSWTSVVPLRTESGKN
jgi:hypothetical protein